MKNKQLCVLALVAVAVAAQASPLSPHVLTRAGVVMGVVSSTSGLQPRDLATGQASGKRQYKPFVCTFSPESNVALVKEIEYARYRSSLSFAWTVHRCDPVSGGGLDFLVQSPGVSSMTFPPLVTNSRLTATCTMSLDCNALTFLSLSQTSPAETKLVTSQKSWLCSNFRLSIDGISDGGSSGAAGGGGGAGCVRIEPITLSLGPPALNGLCPLAMSDMEMSVSILSSPEYFTWLLDVQNGMPDVRTMQLSLTHNDGTPMCTLLCPMQIDCCGPIDVFSLSGSLSKVVLKPAGKVTINDFH